MFNWNQIVNNQFPALDGIFGSSFSTAITAALPIAGTVLGVTIAFKLFKKFTR